MFVRCLNRVMFNRLLFVTLLLLILAGYARAGVIVRSLVVLWTCSDILGKPWLPIVFPAAVFPPPDSTDILLSTLYLCSSYVMNLADARCTEAYLSNVNVLSSVLWVSLNRSKYWTISVLYVHWPRRMPRKYSIPRNWSIIQVIFSCEIAFSNHNQHFISIIDPIEYISSSLLTSATLGTIFMLKYWKQNGGVVRIAKG